MKYLPRSIGRPFNRGLYFFFFTGAWIPEFTITHKKDLKFRTPNIDIILLLLIIIQHQTGKDYDYESLECTLE